MAVKPTTSAYPADAVPVALPYTGRGRPPVPRYRTDPANLRIPALSTGRGAVRQVTWHHGTRRTKGNPTAKMRSRFLAIRVRPAKTTEPFDRDHPKSDRPHRRGEANGWLGEVQGLQISLDAARAKLVSLERTSHSDGSITQLGIPKVRNE